jgi:hypothetical protein
MLLRCSRTAEHLEKLAGLAAVGRGLAGKLETVGKATRAVGGFGKKNWKPLVGAGFVASAAVPMAASGYSRAQQGMTDQNYQARMAGYQRSGLPKVPKV